MVQGAGPETERQIVSIKVLSEFSEPLGSITIAPYCAVKLIRCKLKNALRRDSLVNRRIP